MYFLYFICIFRFLFLQKKNENIPKNTKKNTNAIAQKYKIQKKKYESTISKIQKKNTNQKFQKNKIQRKDKLKNKPESQPRVHCGNQETNCKKDTKPTSCISQTLQFWFCILGLYFWYFFVFLNIGRRPFCRHRRLLKHMLWNSRTRAPVASPYFFPDDLRLTAGRPL